MYMWAERLRGGICIGDSADPRCKKSRAAAPGIHPEYNVSGRSFAHEWKIPFDAAQDGDTAAEKVVNDYICCLGETITNFVNIFRPDIVLLSGGICNQGKKLTEPLETYIQDKCFGGSKAFIPKVACAVLGNKAGIIGAANLISGKER